MFLLFFKKIMTYKLVPNNAVALGELMAGEHAAPLPTQMEMLLPAWLGPS